MYLDENELNNPTKNKIRNNYINLVANRVITGFTRVSEFIQGTSEMQLDLIKSMSIMDYISFSGDGKTLPDGSLKIYSLTGKTDNGINTLDEFSEDYLTVVSGITKYYNYGSTGGTDNGGFLFITSPLTTGNTTTYKSLYDGSWSPIESDGVVYTLFSKIILDPVTKNEFIEELIKDVNENKKPAAKSFVTKYVNDWEFLFDNERKTEIKLIDEFQNRGDYQELKNFNPTRNGVQLISKKRVMTFKTGQGDANLQAIFKDITSSVNFNDSPIVFNGKKQFNG
jgi:nucleoid DNA-binding protein